MENGKLGTITQIEEVFNVCYKKKTYDGYIVDTEAHKIAILIENEQNCSELWGYFYNNDEDLQSFVGKKLEKIQIIGKEDSNYKEIQKIIVTHDNREEWDKYDEDYIGIQFVNFVLSDGSLFQFAVYNGQNGYYGHNIVFLQDEDVLLEDVL